MLTKAFCKSVVRLSYVLLFYTNTFHRYKKKMKKVQMSNRFDHGVTTGILNAWPFREVFFGLHAERPVGRWSDRKIRPWVIDVYTTYICRIYILYCRVRVYFRGCTIPHDFWTTLPAICVCEFTLGTTTRGAARVINSKRYVLRVATVQLA